MTQSENTVLVDLKATVGRIEAHVETLLGEQKANKELVAKAVERLTRVEERATTAITREECAVARTHLREILEKAKMQQRILYITMGSFVLAACTLVWRLVS